MPRIIIRGHAAIFRDEDQITDPAMLRALDGLVYDYERFTDYLGGPGEESRWRLSEAELTRLVEYTMGQWSDGIGENWMCESQSRCGIGIMCLTPGDGVEMDYPDVQVVEEPVVS